MSGYLPLDYDETEYNRRALETWDIAAEAGPPEPRYDGEVCPNCDETIDPDADRCTGCGWYTP